MRFKIHRLYKKKIRLSENQIDHLFISYAMPILKTTSMQKSKNYCQHGETSVYLHSIYVAYLSLRLANLLKLDYNMQSIIKGALLHDFFLYDWHEKSTTHRLHGFTHPFTAYKNACKEYELNAIEKDIILKHMFPMTISPPLYKESLLVCLVDKFCSISETLFFVSNKIKLIDIRINYYLAV